MLLKDSEEKCEVLFQVFQLGFPKVFSLFRSLSPSLLNRTMLQKKVLLCTFK